MKPTTVNTGTQKNCNHSFPIIRPQLFLVLLNLLINNIRIIKTVFDISACKNQKYRSMQEKHIAVILKVGDLQEICLEEEEIVILLSNLLDNAIRESEKVLKNTGKAVIHLKLECEEHKLIFAVRNPVTEKVEIENDTIKSKRGDHQGIGLLNVKAVVDKYGGDMVLSCDEDEFKAVVI